MPKSPKIRGVLTRVYSFRDKFGNVYNAFRYVDCASGIEVKGQLGGGCDSNIRGAIYHLYRDTSSVLYHEEGMSWRDFDKYTATWPSPRTNAEDIARFIQATLRTQKKA